jgi:transcriptional regulator with XRE-family HTH domain
MGLRRDFAANLRRLRLERGLSQEELAHRTGIDRTYVSHLERLRYNPTLDMVERLAAALEIDALELLRHSA